MKKGAITNEQKPESEEDESSDSIVASSSDDDKGERPISKHPFPHKVYFVN